MLHVHIRATQSHRSHFFGTWISNDLFIGPRTETERATREHTRHVVSRDGLACFTVDYEGVKGVALPRGGGRRPLGGVACSTAQHISTKENKSWRTTNIVNASTGMNSLPFFQFNCHHDPEAEGKPNESIVLSFYYSSDECGGVRFLMPPTFPPKSLSLPSVRPSFYVCLTAPEGGYCSLLF